MKDLKQLLQSVMKDKLTESRPKLMLLSLGLAVLVWAMVVLSVDSTYSEVLRDVPIRMPASGAPYQALGLEVIDDGRAYTADVEVSGNRSVIGGLDADDILVVPDFSSVTTEGTYTLQLTAQKRNQLLDYDIVAVLPSTLTLTFDEAQTSRFNVTPQVTGIKVPEGYVLQSIVSSPSYINISGASEEVARIHRVVAEAVLEEEISSSRTMTAALHLYDAQGNEIPTTSVRMERAEVELTIPVYKVGELPLEIGFINVPEGFDTSLLRYTLSPDRIRIASSESNIAQLQTKIVGYVDLAQFQPEEGYTFPLELSTGYVSLDNITEVEVSFNTEGLEDRSITVSDIRVENAPAGTRISVLTDSIRGVTVFGKADSVQKLLPTSVVAVVDANEIMLQQGSNNVPVHFRIPGFNDVWVAGSYNVTIQVESGQ